MVATLTNVKLIGMGSKIRYPRTLSSCSDILITVNGVTICKLIILG